VTSLETDYVLEWVSENPDKRAHRLARMLGRPGRIPSELLAELLRRFDSYGVGSALYAKYMTGSYVGLHSDWVRGQLESARPWLEDPRAAVREWGEGVVRDLEDRLTAVVAREEEERFE
jgi:hypothetical protein